MLLYVVAINFLLLKSNGSPSLPTLVPVGKRQPDQNNSNVVLPNTPITVRKKQFAPPIPRSAEKPENEAGRKGLLFTVQVAGKLAVDLSLEHESVTAPNIIIFLFKNRCEYICRIRIKI